MATFARGFNHKVLLEGPILRAPAIRPPTGYGWAGRRAAADRIAQGRRARQSKIFTCTRWKKTSEHSWDWLPMPAVARSVRQTVWKRKRGRKKSSEARRWGMSG